MWKGWVSGHWEKSKQSGYVHLLYCSSDGRIKAEETSARLVNFLCTGRIMIGAGLDVVCWSIWTPCWPPSILMTASSSDLAVPSLSLQALSSPEDEDLPQCVHLLAQQTWNYSSSKIHTYSSQTLEEKEIVERLRNLREGTFPIPSSTFLFTS